MHIEINSIVYINSDETGQIGYSEIA